MSYDYETEKPLIFTEEGQIKFLKVRDNMNRHCNESGAVSCTKAMGGVMGSS